MTMPFDPFEAERKRLEALSAERVNELGVPPAECSDANSIAKAALKGQGNLLRDAGTRTDHTASEDRLADPNDPYALLRLNRQSAKEVLVLPKERKSARLRDYLLIMILGNGALLGFVAIMPKHPLVYVPALAGVLLLSISTTWTMWVVMDREQFSSSEKVEKKP